MRLFSKIISASFFLIISYLALSPLGAGIGEGTGQVVALGGALLVALFILIAPNARRAWGRGFLMDGAIFIAMPLLVLPLLGRAYSETVQENAASIDGIDQAATEVGAGLGVALAFGAFSMLGIILGVIFLVFGAVLVLGGKREVIVVKEG